jgi:LPXTG-motif cell wall-anchored protein
MNNRRNLKENLTISNKQRFSIRKFSIGVASVMLGTTLYFMGGVGTSIVHADSVQEQPAQTSKLDTNSAQASSDATLAQQDSDQNQSQVSSVQNDEKTTNDQTAVKSSQQATNASAVKSNTQDSKKSVSDTNETKSVANKAQTSDQLATATSDKSSQQVAKTDTKNSNTLDIKQNKQRLADNVKLNALTDNKAQTDTQTNSKYSVTDNYPADLTNYLPSTFNNKQEYAFEWLRDQKGNNIILTTKRTGDGDVYVYQNGEGVGESVPNQPLDLDFGDGYTGTVYNDDNKSGLVQSNPVKVDEFPYPSYYDYNKLTVIYSSHAKDVKKGSYYTGISFFVPHKITQTVTYKDSNDQVIDRLTHTQDGLTGQSYTTGLPSGSDYVRADDHEYLDNITNNSSGLISEFHDGYTCTKDYHDGVKVTFTENDSEGIGAMDYVVKDHGKEVKSGILQYGNSAEYDKYAWNGWDWYKSHSYTIVNPYVPQTTNIVYQYKKLGQVITTDPSGNKTWVYYTVNYTNDQSDPIKIEPVNAKPITGYSAIVKYENKIVSDKNFMPKNLGENTYITYTANDQKATITYVDDVTKKTLASDSQDGKFDHEITFEHDPAEVINGLAEKGYKLVSNDFKDGTKYKADDKQNEFIVHLTHDKQKVNRQDQVIETIHYVYENGSKSQPDHEQTISFTEDGIKDKVTGQIAWTPADSQKFDDVATPVITGYTPDKNSVAGSTVKFGDKDIEVTVTYHNNAQTAKITYVDDVTKKTLASDSQDGKFDHEITFEHDPAEVIKGLEEKGYKLVSDNFKPGIKYQNDNKLNIFEVHLVHTYEPVETSQTITETVHYIDANGKPVAPDHVAKVVIKVTGTRDKVTDSIIWNTPSTGHFDEVISPEVPNMTPDKKLIPGRDVQYGDSDITESVVYTPDNSTSKTPEKPDKPSKEVSKTPEKPDKPSKEVSKIPEKPNKSSKEVSKAPEKSIDSRTVDNHVSAKSTAKRELPQTGATTNTGIWTGLVSMIASLGLLGASKRRKKN